MKFHKSLVSVAVISALLAGCGGGGGSTATGGAPGVGAPAAFGSIANFNTYSVPTAIASNSKTSKFTSMLASLISPAYAKNSVFTWPASDAYTYATWIKSAGNNKYVMYNGGQYFGLDKIASDGTVTAIIPNGYGGESGGGLAISKKEVVYVGGTNNSPWQGVQAVDTNGNVLWTSVQTLTYPPGEMWDVITNAVVIDSNGFIYYLSSPAANANMAGTLFKLDPTNGNVLASQVLTDNTVGDFVTINGQMTINSNDVITITGHNTSGASYVGTYNTTLTELTLVSLAADANNPNGDVGMTALVPLKVHNKAAKADTDSLGNLVILDDNDAPIAHLHDSIIGATTLQDQQVQCDNPPGPMNPGFGVTCGPGVTHKVSVAIGQDSKVALEQNTGLFYVSAVHQHDDGLYYVDINKYRPDGSLKGHYSIKAFDQAIGTYDTTIDANGKLVVFGRAGGGNTFLDESRDGSPTNGGYFEVEINLGEE